MPKRETQRHRRRRATWKKLPYKAMEFVDNAIAILIEGEEWSKKLQRALQSHNPQLQEMAAAKLQLIIVRAREQLRQVPDAGKRALVEEDEEEEDEEENIIRMMRK